MKNYTRILIVLLVALFIAGAFSSCVEKPVDSVTTDAPGTVDATTVEIAEPEETYYIPSAKYNQEEFVILCPGKNDNEWECKDFWSEGVNEDPVIDAVYRRQALIEETFGVKIVMIEDASRGTIANLVTKDSNAGDSTYDIIMQVMSSAYTLAQGDYLINLANVPYLDTTSEVWDQSYLAQTSIGGQNYFATGDITTMDNDATWVMMFNKKLANDMDLPNIYDLVTSGEWTFDKLYELTKDMYQDKDNDSKVDESDVYGIATTIDFIQGLFYAANCRIVTKDNSDMPQLTFNTERNSSVIDDIIKIYYKANQVTFDCHDFASINPLVHLLAQAMFEEDRALFYSEVMQCAIRLRDMETDYGIIPCPKYNKDQENYTTHSVAAVTLCAMFAKSMTSKTEQLERAGMIAQALAVEGKNILTPAYYEKSLLAKGSRDAESQEMLPIIFANRTCDIGYMAEESGIATMYSQMRTMVKQGKNNLASINTKYEKKVNKAITELINEYADNE